MTRIVSPLGERTLGIQHEFGELLVREDTMAKLEPAEKRDVEGRMTNWMNFAIGAPDLQLAFLTYLLTQWGPERVRLLVERFPKSRTALCRALRAWHNAHYIPENAVTLALYEEDEAPVPAPVETERETPLRATSDSRTLALVAADANPENQ